MPTEYFEQRERALLGQRYEQLYAAPQQTAERGVTVSALRTTPEQFAQRADFPLEPSPFCKAAFVVHQPDFKPGRHPYHHAGVFYSQEPSASSAAPLLGVQPGMRVLDLCAAPGGKSSQLAAALQGRGVLVSNEYVAARAEILKSNLERMGVSNAVVLNETPARIAEALPEFFDRVLVDAPCSGEGMFRKEPVALQQHCVALVKQCAELGAQILDCAAAALAPGGQLVYSTCTFAPEEDEAQVAAFLQRHPEFALADVLGNVDYTFGSAGEENRTGGLPLDVSKVRRIWPCQGGEGHFMARLVKAGTPRTLPPEGKYTPEEQLWLAAAAEAGKKSKGKAAKPVKAPPHPGYRGRGGHPCAEPCRMAGVCPAVFPRAGTASGCGARRRRAAAGGFSADGTSCAAGRGVRGQRAKGTLCAGAPSVHGLWQPVHELRAADPCRLPLHRVSLRPRGGSPHSSGRLVLRDRGRLAAGRRQGVRRAGEKPLSQGAAAAVNGQKKRIFPRRMLKTGRIRLERSARLCYNNRVRFCVLPQCGRPQPVCPQAEI